MDTCQYCQKPLEQPKTGRRRKYCDDQCKVAAWKARKTPEVAPCGENAPPVDPDYEEVDLDALSIEQLRVVATSFGLPTTGDSEELIGRILDAATEDKSETDSNATRNETNAVVQLRKWQLSPEEIEVQKAPIKARRRRRNPRGIARQIRGAW